MEEKQNTDSNIQSEIENAEKRLRELRAQQSTQGSTGVVAQADSRTPVAVIAGAVVIAAAIYFGLSSGGGVAQNAGSGAAAPSAPSTAGTAPTRPIRPSVGAVDIADVEIDGEPFIGDENAPVTLAYWMDYQCPFCKRFETTTLIQLEKDYVDTGKLKVVFKDFQFLGSDSQEAGIIAKAIWELYPESFLKWNAAMFVAQDSENGGFGTADSVIQLIKDQVSEINADAVLKLSIEKRSEYQKEQDADKVEAAAFGISGTPGFVIGTQTISGAQPTSVFTQIIDAQLNQ